MPAEGVKFLLAFFRGDVFCFSDDQKRCTVWWRVQKFSSLAAGTVFAALTHGNMHLFLAIILFFPLRVFATCPDEPAVVEVQEVALRYAHMEPHHLGDWREKVKKARWLPRLQVDYGRKVINDIDVDVTDSVYVGSSGVVVGPDEGTFSQNASADQSVGVRAIWRLDELVFNRDELLISAESRSLMRERQALLAEVNRQYFRRHQLRGEIALLRENRFPLKKGEDRRHQILLKEIEITEAAAALDALTGGWFSKVQNPLEGK